MLSGKLVGNSENSLESNLISYTFWDEVLKQLAYRQGKNQSIYLLSLKEEKFLSREIINGEGSGGQIWPPKNKNFYIKN